jgi:1-acyl-sn-glycerol-3-phosphate acyltransferase
MSGGAALRRRWRAARRLARALAQVAGGLAIVALRFPRLDAVGRRREVRCWSQRVLRALDIALVADGAPAQGAALLVANHVSWLDIVAIDAVVPARFVAKAQMRDWPLLGRLVSAGGTIYLTRERSRDARRVAHDMAAALAAGDTLAVFPEGTTGDGHALLPFHANLLQAAISAGAPVQPVALRFFDARHAVSPATEFVGRTTLAQSLWRVACADGLGVRVSWLAPEAAAARPRRELAAALRLRLDAALGRPAHPGSGSEARVAPAAPVVSAAPAADTMALPSSSRGTSP